MTEISFPRVESQQQLNRALIVAIVQRGPKDVSLYHKAQKALNGFEFACEVKPW